MRHTLTRLQRDRISLKRTIISAACFTIKTDEAMASYRQALAIYPDFAEAHSNLGTGRMTRKSSMKRRLVSARRWTLF